MPKISHPPAFSILLLFFFTLNLNSTAQPVTKASSACDYAKNIGQFTNVLTEKKLALLVRNKNDDCNERLVDSIFSYFISKGNIEGYRLIDNLARVTDGYLSDELTEKMERIYKKAFPVFFDFLYQDYQQHRENKKLKRYISEGLSLLAMNAQHGKNEADRIKKRCRTLVSNPRLSDNQARLNYLNGILAEVNPDFLD